MTTIVKPSRTKRNQPITCKSWPRKLRPTRSWLWLTAKAFWPIYDAYQNDFAQLNVRLYKLIETYAGYYNNDTLTDARARELTDGAIAIEAAELELKRSYLPKLYDVLPAAKVARYIQIENKIRAIVKLEIAGQVSLVP